jgi:hypothetical protein
MKKYKFKKVLLALGLVFATLSMSVTKAYQNPSPCCDEVDLDKIVASYTTDTTFEIYIKADENLRFQRNRHLGYWIYNKLVKNNGKYVSAKITLHDDDGTGHDEFKIVVTGLDFGSRLSYSWTDLVAMGKEVFENYNWGAATYRKIKFYGTSQFHRGDKDYNDEDDDTDNTGWDHVDNEMHVVERGVRWDKQKLVVDAAKIQVLNSLAITFNIGTGASVARKRAHLGEFKARVAAYKTGVNKLNHPGMTTEHMNVIIAGRVEYKLWELKITPFEKELEEIWAKQYQATNEVYESAKAVKEQREDNAPTVTLRDFVAQYLKEINFLKTMEYTAAEKDKVIEHQANYSALKEALDIAMAADSRVRNNIFAIIDTESEEGVQQVVLFTPKLTFGWWYYTITIDNISHSVMVHGMSVEEIMQAFAAKFSAHPTVECIVFVNFLCMAKQENVPFEYSATAEETTQEDAEARESQRNAVIVKAVQAANIKASYVVKTLWGGDYVKITSKKEAEAGNGQSIRYLSTGVDNVCFFYEATLFCGTTAKTAFFLYSFNEFDLIQSQKFSAELLAPEFAQTLVHEAIGSAPDRNWVLSGGKKQTQIVRFSPILADTYKTYTITIADVGYSILVNSRMTVEQMVDALALELDSDTTVTCVEDNISLTCSAVTEGQAFAFASSVTAREATQAEKDAEAEALWQPQLVLTEVALVVATNARLVADEIVHRMWANVETKAAKIEASKQANAAFLSEIIALDAVKRTEADASIITTFNNQHQTLQAQTSELDAIAKKAIADAIAHRVAEAEALWQNSVRLANVALATATSAEVDANNAVNSDGSFASKEAAITVLKEANAAFNMAIRALDSVKRDEADATVVAGFNNQLQTLQRQASALEATLAAAPWLTQLALTNTALVTATNARIAATSVINGEDSFADKWAAIEVSKQYNAAFDVSIQALDSVKNTNEHVTTIATFNNQLQTLQAETSAIQVVLEAAIEAKRAADLAAPWLTQLALTNTAFTTASNAAIEANSVLASTVDFPAKTAAIEASKQANEAFKVEIQALDAVKRDQDDGVIVTTFNNQHQALKTQITELEVALAAAIEAKRVADLAAPWQAQLALTDSALITANTVVSNAASVMNSDAELSSKTTAVEASKQANAVFISAIQALKLVERDATDGAVTTAFNDQYQTLLTQTTALEATLAMAIEAKRVADLAAPWLAQLALTNAALTAANEAMNNARFEMETDAELSSKTTVVEASKQANAVFISAIQALKLVERDATDGAVTTAFTAQHQTLLEQNNALEATLAASEEKRVFDEATLTGYWKFPVIKGLNYQTTTHPSGITDETGAFKCQPGEVVAFSIENLSLTQVDCQAVLQTKMTKSVSLNVASTGDGFKDWQDEEGKQVIITKVLFGLFNDNIKTAFAQADEALKFITVKLTEVQKGNTANQSLDANDLSVMVQNVLGTTEAVVLPTTEQATNMVTSGWQANKVFDAVDIVDTKGKADTKDKADTEDKADTDASKKSSSGGGCVYNPNAPGRADVGFILLMVLSVYYLVRRKRLTT